MSTKIEVNGPGAHPIYRHLTQTADRSGAAGDVQPNFEKFLVDGTGESSSGSVPAPSRQRQRCGT